MNSFHSVIPIREASQPFAARNAAREAADLASFGEEDSYRAGLVATELATNLVRHTALGGEVLVRTNARTPAGEVELIAIDRGPGMTDVDACFADGASSAGTLGLGLGAVSRLADEFDVHSEPGRGTVVLARLRAARQSRPPHVYHWSGISVPVSGETHCGDAWDVRCEGDRAVVMVVDGLGHGLHASTAATCAARIFGEQTYAGPGDMLQRIHAGIAHTRGAAATIVEIRPDDGAAVVAGVGNVCAVLSAFGGSRSGVSLPGILGHQIRQVREYSYTWDPATVVVLHSDGLTMRWSLDAYPGLRTRHPSVIAAVLYRDFSRGRDDVTVVVGRKS